MPDVVGTCKMPCGGDKGEMCGGYGVMSIFQRGGAAAAADGDDKGVTKGKNKRSMEDHAAWHAGRAGRIAS